MKSVFLFLVLVFCLFPEHMEAAAIAVIPVPSSHPSGLEVHGEHGRSSGAETVSRKELRRQRRAARKAIRQARQQARRSSGWNTLSIVAFLASLTGLTAMVFIALFWGLLSPWVYVLWIIGGLGGIVLGSISLIKISNSETEQKGQIVAMMAILLGVIAIALVLHDFIFYVL